MILFKIIFINSILYYRPAHTKSSHISKSSRSASSSLSSKSKLSPNKSASPPTSVVPWTAGILASCIMLNISSSFWDDTSVSFALNVSSSPPSLYSSGRSFRNHGCFFISSILILYNHILALVKNWLLQVV